MSGEAWTAANQRVLVAEFARISALLSDEPLAAVESELADARRALPAPAAIDAATEAFELSEFERDVLLICAGVELDTSVATACAASVDPGLQRRATFALALAKLPGAHWSALAPTGPLRSARLVHLRDERSLTSSGLDIDERMLHFIAGINYLDARLQPLMRELDDVNMLAETHESAVQHALEVLAGEDRSRIAQVIGDDAPTQLEVARRVAARLGLRLHVLRAGDIPADAHEAQRLAAIWNRESVLLPGALLVEVEESDPAVMALFVARIKGLVFVATCRPLAIPDSFHVRVARLNAIEQKRLWVDLLGDSAIQLNGSLDAVSAQFRLSPNDIARHARSLRRSRLGHRDLEDSIWKSCSETVRHRLDELAQRVEPVAGWNDLVLPEPMIATLRLIAAQVRNRLKVHLEWGFSGKSSRGLGISVLFSGESGTGKTMAAEVLARELHLDLYRIDLSSMVSKYIGETEKNLRRVFDAAEDFGAILLFDEADALFGKRSEVKDSHDRYANIEVSYLLQRMEAYRGLAILTTNLRGALDAAFLRRLRFIVQFPFPDDVLRERIWRGVFPEDVPLGEIDFRRLAQLNVSGGNIHNIAVNAAFLAADAGAPLGMPQLLQAARSEASKRERPFSDAETRGWA